MAHHPSLESLETRQLLAFAPNDRTFNNGNAVTLGGDNTAGGMVFATPDGGSIVQTGNGELRRFTAAGKHQRGKASSFGGVDGVLGTPGGSVKLLPGAGDSTTGRFATIYDNGTRSQRKLRIYAANGTLERSIDTDVLPQLVGSATDSGFQEPKMVFDSQGRLLIATTPGQGLRISRVNVTTGQLDASFGTNGVAQLELPPTNIIDLYPELLTLGVGANDSLLLAGRYSTDNSQIANVRIFVLDSTGEPKAGFGASGYVDVVSQSIESHDAAGSLTTTRFSREMLDVALAPDGSVLIASVETTRIDGELDLTRGEALTTLQRISATGVAGESVELDTSLRLDSKTHARLLFDSGNATLIVSGEQRVAGHVSPDQTQSARVYRFDVAASDLDTFAFDSASGGSNGSIVPHAFQLADATLDEGGRLLAFGQRARFDDVLQPELLRLPLDGASTIIEFDSVRLNDDGVLVINGDESADQINVRMKGSDIIVSHLSSVMKFQARRVTGILIRGLGGNDLITLGSSLRTAYVLAGEGNDTVYGSARSEIIEGNGGNDYLDGAGGDDLLYGSADKDLLVGGDGGDSLFGGTGNDVVYANKATQPQNDLLPNLLVGGSGIDRLVRSGHSSSDLPDRVIKDDLDILI